MKHLYIFLVCMQAAVAIRHVHRRTTVGDFDRFNSLFENSSINIGDDFVVSQNILFSTLVLTIRHIRCFQISVGDISVSHNRKSEKEIDVEVDVSQLDIQCNVDYQYEYGFLHGTGVAYVATDDNSLSTILNFDSHNFDTQPPEASSVESCSTDIRITNIELSGDLLSDVIEIAENMIRGVLESEIEKVACNELGSLGTSFVSDMLKIAGETLGPYNGDLGDDMNDPLYLERNNVLPADLVPLNLQDTENIMGNWFNQALQEADLLLGSIVPDPNGPHPDKRDLGVNVLLRSHFLDEYRALMVDVSQLPIDTVLFKGHDRITETTITLNSIRVLGLDSFERFNPLMDLGKFTLKNELTWEKLSLDFDVTVDVTPSTREDAILQDSTSKGISERITIGFGVENVDVVASLFLVIDQEALGAMEIGPLLTFENLMPCLLSVIHEMKLSGMDVNPLTVNAPTLTGFVSPGIDRIVSNSVQSAFSMYEGFLRNLIPNIFQSSIRNFINREVIDTYVSPPTRGYCPNIKEVEGFIDFRDLLLEPETAKSHGASGLMPYGDIAYTIKGMIEENLLSTGDDGLLELNSFLVHPMTQAQSGIPGTISFGSGLASLVMTTFENGYLNSLLNRVEIGLFDTRINNLDSLMPPAQILETTDESHMLTNVFNMGPVPNRFINATTGLLLALDGDESPLNMHNEVGINFFFPSATLQADIFALVDASRFLHFPLKDVLNTQCWLALVPAPALDKNGEVVVGSEPTFLLSDFVMSLKSLDFSIDVITNTSPGVTIIPEFFQLFKTIGGIDTLRRRFVELGEEILQQDKIQMAIDRSLVNAPKLCPHRPEYSEDKASLDNTIISFPDLSRKTIDSIFYSASLLTQMSVFAVLESHRLKTSEPTNAYSAQNRISTPNSLLDLTNLNGKLGKLLEMGRVELKKYLGGSTEISDLGINALVRDLLLEENSDYLLLFEDVTFEVPGITIALSSLKISGLDSFTSFSILEVIAAQTFQNKMELNQLAFSLEFKIFDSTMMDELQTFTVSSSLDKIQAEIPIFLGLSQGRLGSLPIGSLFQTQNIFACLWSVVDFFEVTQMKVSVGTFSVPTIEGLMSDTHASIQKFTEQLLLSYDSAIIEGIPTVFDVTLRQLVNKLAEAYLKTNDCAQKTASFKETMYDFVDFRDLFFSSEKAREFGGSGLLPYGNVFQTIFTYAQELVSKVDPSTGLSVVNEIFSSQFTESGSLLFPGELFGGGSRVQVGGLDANIKLRTSDARIDNLDTITPPLVLLQPIVNQAHELNNTATLGVADKPLRFAAKFLISLMDDDDLQLENDMEVSLDLYSASVVLQTMTKVAESSLYNFPIVDIFDYNCWLATIPAPGLDKHGVRIDGAEPTAILKEVATSVASLNLNVSCIKCSSPRLSELAELLSTVAAQEDLTESANGLLDYARDFLTGNYLQVKIDRILNDAARKCPHSPLYEEGMKDVQFEAFQAPNNELSISFLLMLTILAGSLVLAVLASTFAIKCFVRQRHKKWLKKLPPHQLERLALEQHKEENEESELNAVTISMFKSPDVPFFVRMGMPLIILGSIAFFVSGHLSLGATVNIEAELAGEKIHIEKFFEFSMARSTVDIWNAGGKELAILILVFSGVWPYTKQLITLVLWFLPPTKCSVSRRESILLWLDCLGKWSMIDIFVLVISIAAFRVSIVSPEAPFLPEDFYTLDLLVVPLWGLYANMIAQLISQVSSHYIIYYHRRIVHQARQSNRKKDQTSQAVLNGNKNDIKVHCSSFDENISSSGDSDMITLHQHRYSRPHRGERDMLIVRSWINKLLVIVVFSLILCVVIGCYVSSFSLEILGIIGVAVESGQNFRTASTRHSIFTVIQLLFEEAEFLDTVGDYVGLGTLSMLFVFTVLLVPIIQSVALLYQWFKPSTREQKMKMSVILEILQAWQYAEVYLIAIFVASWQLGPVSEFMINSYCESLNDTFAELVYFGLLKEEDAQCFSVRSSIENGSYILVVGAILLSLVNSFVSKAVIQYFRDKKEEKKLISGGSANFLLRNNDVYHHDSNVDYDAKIRPVPVLFSDSFRWLLIRDDARVGSNSFFAAFGYHKISGRLPLMSPLTGDDNCNAVEENSDVDEVSNGENYSESDDFEDEDESGWTSVEEESHQNNSLLLEEL